MGYTLYKTFKSQKMVSKLPYNKYGFGEGQDVCVFKWVYKIEVEPDAEYDWSQKPTMLLTNRSVYSTANLFTSIVKLAPNVTQVGGRSGGGGGLPETYYLPNGWALVFPSNVLFDINMQHIENGIEPDVEVHISREDEYNDKDSILEKAIELLMQK